MIWWIWIFSLTLSAVVVVTTTDAKTFLRSRRTGNESVDAALSLYHEKLYAELLNVSLLVSNNCPVNVKAHRLVIDAGQCLTCTGKSAVVMASYNRSFAALRQARKIAGDVPTREPNPNL